MKKITANDLIAATYVFLGVIALFPPTTNPERALGFCLIIVSLLFGLAARDCEKLIDINKDTLRRMLLLSNISDETRAELTKLLEGSK